MNFDWEMSQPLVLPAPQGDSSELAMAPNESSVDTRIPKEQDTQSTLGLTRVGASGELGGSLAVDLAF